MSPNKAAPTDFTPIIDAHAHLGKFRNFHIPRADAVGLVASLDAYGIDAAVISSHAAISADVVRGNDETLAALDAHPGRLYGYTVVNPNYGDEAAAELERCFAHPAMRGIKLHPELHGDHPVTGPGYTPAWEFADAHGLPVLSHTYFAGDPLEAFATLADRYPRATLLLGHAGIDHGVRDVVRLVSEHPNVVLDLCGALVHARVLEDLLEHLPVDRLVLGTDMPFISGARQIGTILYSGLSREEQAIILGGTAAQLFRIGEVAS